MIINEEQKQQIKQLYDEGKSIKDICKSMNIQRKPIEMFMVSENMLDRNFKYRNEYKKSFNENNYERLGLYVPKGMKQVIKDLASNKDMSVNAYFLHLVTKDQETLFDSMQLAEKSREKILTIQGNTSEGYKVYFKDGRIVDCKTKLEIRKCLTADNK